jgi:neutral ceramidase
MDGTLSEFYDPDTYTYLEVQRRFGDGWKTIAMDGDPYTMFDWARTGGSLSATSEATVTWEVRNVDAGTYRIVYNGLAKQSFLGLGAKYRKFVGISSEFVLQD